MGRFLHLFGWLVIAAWLVVLVAAWTGADFGPFRAGRHLEAGLGVLLAALLIQSLPTFWLIGVVARLRAARPGSAEEERRFDQVLRLKNGLHLPAAAAILATLAVPVAGFLEAGARVPDRVHLFVSLLALALHLVFWARALFALRFAEQLAALDLAPDEN